MDRGPCRFVAKPPLGILIRTRFVRRISGGGSVTGAEREAAAVVWECRREFAEKGSTTAREAMAGALDIAGEPVPWYRYPEGEVYDPRCHAQYFYHCHPATAAPARNRFGGDAVDPAEHGHFHLFLRAEGMPRGVSPMVFPDEAVVADKGGKTPPQAAPLKRGSSDRVAHLFAIAVDAHGEPVRLFTTNRWVTGETWYRAADVVRMLDRFTPAGDASPLLDRWLGAMVKLYRAEIEWLLNRRDEAVAKWRWLWPRRGSVLEDPRLEITSHLDIDLDARLVELDRGGQSPRVAVSVPRRPSLPNLADGWGA